MTAMPSLLTFVLVWGVLYLILCFMAEMSPLDLPRAVVWQALDGWRKHHHR